MNLWSFEFLGGSLFTIVLSLAAAYSKSPFDRLFEQHFATVRERREKYRQKAVRLSSRPLMIVHMMHEEARLRGQSVLYTVAALVLAIFASGVGDKPVSLLLACMVAGTAVIGFTSNVRAGHREMLVTNAVKLSGDSEGAVADDLCGSGRANRISSI